jgi:hypothetical protein
MDQTISWETFSITFSSKLRTVLSFEAFLYYQLSAFKLPQIHGRDCSVWELGNMMGTICWRKVVF